MCNHIWLTIYNWYNKKERNFIVLLKLSTTCDRGTHFWCCNWRWEIWTCCVYDYRSVPAVHIAQHSRTVVSVYICMIIYDPSYMTNNIWTIIYDSPHTVVIYDSSHTVDHIWLTTYGQSYMTHHIWSVIYGSPHMVKHIWSTTYNQSYMVYF